MQEPAVGWLFFVKRFVGADLVISTFFCRLHWKRWWWWWCLTSSMMFDIFCALYSYVPLEIIKMPGYLITSSYSSSFMNFNEVFTILNCVCKFQLSFARLSYQVWRAWLQVLFYLRALKLTLQFSQVLWVVR